MIRDSFEKQGVVMVRGQLTESARVVPGDVSIESTLVRGKHLISHLCRGNFEKQGVMMVRESALHELAIFGWKSEA